MTQALRKEQKRKALERGFWFHRLLAIRNLRRKNFECRQVRKENNMRIFFFNFWVGHFSIPQFCPVCSEISYWVISVFFFSVFFIKKCKFISFCFHRTKTNMGFNPHPDPLFVTRYGIKPIMSLLSCVSIFSFVESKKKIVQ